MFRTSFLFFFLFIITIVSANAQDLKTSVGDNRELDSLRKMEENKRDSVIFTAKYIRYTTVKLSLDSLQTVPLDTTLNNLQNYSVIHQPRRPTTGLGNLGLAVRPLLFESTKNIGFDPGFHSLEPYFLESDDVVYYRARTPFSSLYYVNGGDAEQVFKVIYTQNIKKNWNAGFNYNRIGANGFYNRQRGDDLGVSFFSWYQSPSNRYNLFASVVFNTLKAAENGSITNDSLFSGNALSIDRKAESVRLSTAKQLWRKTVLSLRNTYLIGRIDSSEAEGATRILATNKITYNFNYSTQAFSFFKDEIDAHTVLPKGISDDSFYPDDFAAYTKDSTSVSHLQNEFMYSFFLRPKQGSFIKNELKINAGIRHDLYQYRQSSELRDARNLYLYNSSFQNISLLGNAGYKFSDRINLNLDVQQVIQGRNFGDFLYEAKSNVLLSDKIGSILLGAYIQNKSPEQIFEKHFSNHYQWDTNFDNTKTLNLSANYINDKLQLDAGAEYFLVTNYLYFSKSGQTGIIPMQHGSDISLLRFTLGKKFSVGRFNLDLYVAYQKTDNAYILRTPEIYTFDSFYFNQTFFKVLKTQIGADIRYNTTFLAYSYSPAASQFYIGDDITLGSKPVVSVWVKAGLRRANLFVKYDYVNQGLFNLGYYTTNFYPMGDRLFKFGVQWNFYD